MSCMKEWDKMTLEERLSHLFSDYEAAYWNLCHMDSGLPDGPRDEYLAEGKRKFEAKEEIVKEIRAAARRSLVPKIKELLKTIEECTWYSDDFGDDVVAVVSICNIEEDIDEIKKELARGDSS